MPKKGRRRRPKQPEACPRLIAFLMEFRGMSKAQATSTAARARVMRDEPQVVACMVCGGEIYVLDPASPLPAGAVRDAQDAHMQVCGKRAA